MADPRRAGLAWWAMASAVNKCTAPAGPAASATRTADGLGQQDDPRVPLPYPHNPGHGLGMEPSKTATLRRPVIDAHGLGRCTVCEGGPTGGGKAAEEGGLRCGERCGAGKWMGMPPRRTLCTGGATPPRPPPLPSPLPCPPPPPPKGGLRPTVSRGGSWRPEPRSSSPSRDLVALLDRGPLLVLTPKGCSTSARSAIPPDATHAVVCAGRSLRDQIFFFC